MKGLKCGVFLAALALVACGGGNPAAPSRDFVPDPISVAGEYKLVLRASEVCHWPGWLVEFIDPNVGGKYTTPQGVEVDPAGKREYLATITQVGSSFVVNITHPLDARAVFYGKDFHGTLNSDAVSVLLGLVQEEYKCPECGGPLARLLSISGSGTGRLNGPNVTGTFAGSWSWTFPPYQPIICNAADHRFSFTRR